MPLAALPISVTIDPFLGHGDVCGLGNGLLVASISGGTPPYTIQWSNGVTEEENFGLSAGNYTVTVTDALSDEASAQGTVEACALGDLAQYWIMSQGGFPDPYCGGALSGPFFRMRSRITSLPLCKGMWK
jgi:hypothetical protein